MLSQDSHKSSVGQSDWKTREAVKSDELTVQWTLVDSESQATKTISIGPDNRPKKTAATALYRGTAQRQNSAGSAAEVLTAFAGMLKCLGPRQVVICAPPPSGREDWSIVRRDELDATPNAIARTSVYFAPVAGAALMMLDIDPDAFPPVLLSRIRDAGNLSNVLARVHPPFASAAVLTRASVSAGVRVKGKTEDKPAGSHRYYVVDDGRAVERFAGILAKRLIIAGFGYGKVTSSGHLLIRTLFDVDASGDTSRLCYEADAVLTDDRLVRDSDARKPSVRAGGVLDISSIADLTADEEAQYDAAVEALHTASAPEIAAAKQAYLEKRVAEAVAKGEDPEKARRRLSADIDRCELSGDFEIYLDDGRVVTVLDILADPESFHRLTCADPHEPDYGAGRNLAIIYSDQRPVRIESLAHGGISYRLWEGAAFWFDDLGEPEVAQVRGDATTSSARGLAVITGLIDPVALPVREWLVQPRLPIGDVAQCVGAPGTSKSTLALRDALAVATGREDLLRGKDAAGAPISPERLHQAGAVVVYNAEDRLDEMQRRLAATQRHHGLSPSDMRHPIILWSGVDHQHLVIMHRVGDRAPLTHAPGLVALEQVIREHNAVLVILDPQISLCAGGRENDNNDQDALLQELARLASRCGVAIMVIHHTAKATQNAKGDMAAGRGGFAAVGKVRSAFTIVGVTGAGDEKEWGAGPDSGWMRLDYSKVSHDRKPMQPIVFKRMSVPVGNGEAVSRRTAETIFDADPRAALRATGDFAPVLELVDLKSAIASTKRKPVADADAEAIARIVDDLMAQSEEVGVSRIIDPAGERMRQAGLTKAKARHEITGKIVSALAGDGVVVDQSGQLVRLIAHKRGDSPTAPWIVRRQMEGAND